MQSDSRMDKLLPIRTDKRYLGIFFTLQAWLLISATSPTLKFNSTSLSFYNTCFYQFLVAFMAITIWSGFKGKPNIFSKNPIGITINSLLSATCYISYFLFRTANLSFINSIIFNLDIFIVAALCITFFKQKIHLYSWFGITMAFLGLASTHTFNFSFQGPNALIETFSSLSTTFAFAFLVLSTHYLVRNSNSPLVICLYNSLIGFFCFGSLAWITGLQLPSIQDLPYLFFSGIFYAIALLLFTSSHRYLEAYIIMALGFIEPVFQKLLHFAFRDQLPSMLNLSHCVVVCLGITLTVLPTFLEKKRMPQSLKTTFDTAA